MPPLPLYTPATSNWRSTTAPHHAHLRHMPATKDAVRSMDGRTEAGKYHTRWARAWKERARASATAALNRLTVRLLCGSLRCYTSVWRASHSLCALLAAPSACGSVIASPLLFQTDAGERYGTSNRRHLYYRRTHFSVLLLRWLYLGGHSLRTHCVAYGDCVALPQRMAGPVLRRAGWVAGELG